MTLDIRTGEPDFQDTGAIASQRNYPAELAVARMGPGDHACWTYACDHQHRSVVGRYLRGGLACGQRVVYLGSRSGPELVAADYLEVGGVDTDALLGTGQLMLRRADEVYAPAGVFDPDDRIRSYRRLNQQARDDGFEGARVAAETSWLLDDHAALEAWPAYELRADLLAAQAGFTALCLYDGRLWDEQDAAVSTMPHRLSLDVDVGAPRGLFLHGLADGGVAVGGELDFSQADSVASVLSASVDDMGASLLDVTELTFVDIAGVRAIAATAKLLVERNGVVRIAGAGRTFKRVWTLLGLDRRIPDAVI